MSKERLDHIERKMKNTDSSMLYVPYEELEWVIQYAKEQAERVQELENENDILNQSLADVTGVSGFMIKQVEEQNKELLEGLATIGNAIHEGEISGRGTDENLILEVVDKHWRNRNE